MAGFRAETDDLIVGALPLVKKVASDASKKYRAEFEELYAIGALEVVAAARERWKPAAKGYPDEGTARAHFWLFVRPRVVGAIVDSVRDRRPKPKRRDADFALVAAPDEASFAETADLIETVYNSCGQADAELFRDLALTGKTKVNAARERGVSVWQLNRRWGRVCEKIKKYFRSGEENQI